MLEVRPTDDGFIVFDIQADEPLMRFDDRRAADRLIADMQIQELHAKLQRWSPDAGDALAESSSPT